MQTYYQILGVSSAANPAEIKAAYKRLVFRYHPDRNGGDNRFHELMIKINEAYSVLINPAKRVAYDSQLYNQATAKRYYDYTRNADNSTPQYSEKKKSRWSFASPTILTFWIVASVLGKVVTNYVNYHNYESMQKRPVNFVGNPTIQEIFSPKISNQVFPQPEINRIYDSLNPQY
jgi:curved DNA-binding protein CbpA